jgi:hypothetical protein
MLRTRRRCHGVPDVPRRPERRCRRNLQLHVRGRLHRTAMTAGAPVRAQTARRSHAAEAPAGAGVRVRARAEAGDGREDGTCGEDRSRLVRGLAPEEGQSTRSTTRCCVTYQAQPTGFSTVASCISIAVSSCLLRPSRAHLGLIGAVTEEDDARSLDRLSGARASARRRQSRELPGVRAPERGPLSCDFPTG